MWMSRMVLRCHRRRVIMVRDALCARGMRVLLLRVPLVLRLADGLGGAHLIFFFCLLASPVLSTKVLSSAL